MFLTKIKIATAALILGMMALWGGTLTYRTLAAAEPADSFVERSPQSKAFAVATPGQAEIAQKDEAKEIAKPIFRMRVHIEKVNTDSRSINAYCPLWGKLDGVTKPSRFEHLSVSENAKLKHDGKDLKFADLKPGTDVLLELEAASETALKVVGIETGKLKPSQSVKQKRFKMRVHVEKVNADSRTITASCLILGLNANDWKPLRFEHLSVSENAKIKIHGKDLRFTDLKPGTDVFLEFEAASEFGLMVVGIETLGKPKPGADAGQRKEEDKEAVKKPTLPKGGDAAQDSGAEKLYRAMEKKVRAAKSLRVVLGGELDSIKGTIKATIYATQGNKSRMEIDFDIDGKADKVLLLTDGNAHYTKQGKKGTLDPNPMNPEQDVPGMIARIGFTGAMMMVRSAKPGKEKEVHLDKDAPVTNFKLGAKEMVGDKTAQVVTYKLDFDGMSAKMSVWIDTKTHLPLKRVVAVDQGGQMLLRITETYSSFAIDPKLDPKLFEIPEQ